MGARRTRYHYEVEVFLFGKTKINFKKFKINHVLTGASRLIKSLVPEKKKKNRT